MTKWLRNFIIGFLRHPRATEAELIADRERLKRDLRTTLDRLAVVQDERDRLKRKLDDLS